MSDCQYNSQLNAYHDGELDAETSWRVRNHLPTCPACSKELAALEATSALFAAEADRTRLSQIELARLHQSLEPSKLQGQRERGEDSDLLRTAGLLSALAASVLIVSTVWLAEFPSRPNSPVSPAGAVGSASEFTHQTHQALAQMPQTIPPWERAAMTLHVDPRPEYSGDAIGFASASPSDPELADWMIAGLAGRTDHANP